jgi:CMP/dCMP kinase
MGLDLIDVVTIDGPAGSGKSTIARSVADTLSFRFLDTGAMYRAVALGAVKKGIAVSDTDALAEYLEHLNLNIHYSDNTMNLVLDGRNVTDEIRQPGMSRHASNFSANKAVRNLCSSLQRQIGMSGKIVCEGRDMGTVVFPDARWKFFLTASVEERARRRWKELREKGQNISLMLVKDDIEYRDLQDSNRKLAPLKQASDARIIDTTNMTIQCVTNKIVGVVAPIIAKKR